VADDNTYQVPMDTPTLVVLTGSDFDTDPIIFFVDTLPAHGQISGTPPNVTYTPDPGYTGPDQFTFHTSDHILDSTPGTITIDVLASNTPPVAYDDSTITPPMTPVDITLTGFDADGDPLEFWIVTLPPVTNGLLLGATTPPYMLAGDTVTYEPMSTFSGFDTFEFQVFDGQDWSNVATITVEVLPF